MQISLDLYRIGYKQSWVRPYNYPAHDSPANLRTNYIKPQNTYQVPFDTITFASRDISEAAKKYNGKIKVVFSDIDGTLSYESDYLSPPTKNAVSKLYEKNIPVVLVTGRCYKDTLPIIEQFSQYPDYVISSLGGCITDKNGSVLKNVLINKQEGKKFADWYNKELAENKDVHLIMYFDDDPYSVSEIQYPWKARELIKKLDSFDTLLESDLPLNKIIIYNTNKKSSNIDNIISGLNDYGIHNLQLQKAGNSFYEFFDKNVSKSDAIKEVLDLLNLTPDKAMAIGDSPNDADMLTYIKSNNGLSVAMKDAPEEVISCSNATTDSVLEEGFAKCIKYIFTT